VPGLTSNTSLTVTLAYHGLELRAPQAGLREDRPLGDADLAALHNWTQRHLVRARSHLAGDDELLRIGTEMAEWLNGETSALRRALAGVAPPVIAEFRIERDDESDRARAFWDAPWELLALDGRYLALDEGVLLCPLRRLGAPQPPAPPSPYRLSLVFMAAAPRGADNLDYEAEEAAILDATGDIEIDLAVEESGTLDRLARLIAREQPDIVHLSCHGVLLPQPSLLLEDDLGDADPATTARLVSELAGHKPRALFLSACQTAQADPVTSSLARSLVRAGAPAVFGWAESVLDRQATDFAARLYDRLSKGQPLEAAFAWARYELAQANPRRASDWHLARAYLAGNGGGTLATADGPRRRLGAGRATKAFLDAKGERIPVASESEFVGRRRQIQEVLRIFRGRGAERRAGVLIHGLGGQGKSSLAARVAQRMEGTHAPVVVHERYDAAAILRAFADAVPAPDVSRIVHDSLPRVEEDPDQLRQALGDLLRACDQVRRDRDGRLITQPVLLIVDDFERALEMQPDGLHRVRPPFVAPIRALIQAFNRDVGESRLLITSRYRFTLPDEDGRTDLAERLHSLSLPGMNERESRKQIAARLNALDAARAGPVVARQARIIAAARGNPRLQDLLARLADGRPEACDRCLEAMEVYYRQGAMPDARAQAARDFLEDLALRALLDLLSPGQREWLRRSTLFGLPVPMAALQALVDKGPPADAARLIALGLWERYDGGEIAPDALCRPLLHEVVHEPVVHHSG
jgi:hypothetical protein